MPVLAGRFGYYLKERRKVKVCVYLTNNQTQIKRLSYKLEKTPVAYSTMEFLSIQFVSSPCFQKLRRYPLGIYTIWVLYGKRRPKIYRKLRKLPWNYINDFNWVNSWAKIKHFWRSISQSMPILWENYKRKKYNGFIYLFIKKLY